MEREFLIKLTSDLYRLTLYFPKKEPLRYKMRETAVNFLANPNKKDLEVLNNFFEVTLIQNWAKSSEVLAIKQGYGILRDKLELKEQPKVAQKIQKATEVSVRLPARQEKILSFLKQNGKAQVWQVKEVLPEVTKRTLRRDFENLLNQGIIERFGERNNTFYQLKNEILLQS